MSTNERVVDLLLLQYASTNMEIATDIAPNCIYALFYRLLDFSSFKHMVNSDISGIMPFNLSLILITLALVKIGTWTARAELVYLPGSLLVPLSHRCSFPAQNLI